MMLRILPDAAAQSHNLVCAQKLLFANICPNHGPAEPSSCSWASGLCNNWRELFVMLQKIKKMKNPHLINHVSMTLGISTISFQMLQNMIKM